MAELLVAGQSNDEILESLSYKLGPPSEYIQQRRQSRFHPSGASSYSSNTTQIARIELKGQGGYLDMSTLKICFRLAETGGGAAAHPLRRAARARLAHPRLLPGLAGGGLLALRAGAPFSSRS